MADEKINGFGLKDNPSNSDVYVIFDSESLDPNSEEANKGIIHRNVNKKIVETVFDDYTLLVSDGNKVIQVDKATDVQVDIIATSLEEGDEVVIEQTGDGLINIVGTGVDISNIGGLVSSGQGSGFRILRKEGGSFLAESLVGGGGGGSGDMNSSVYDPNNIASDSFDRSNHTGSIDGDDIEDGTISNNKMSSVSEGVWRYRQSSGIGPIENITTEQAIQALVDGGILQRKRKVDILHDSDGPLNIDLSTGESFQITLRAEITILSVTNAVAPREHQLIIYKDGMVNNQIGEFSAGQFDASGGVPPLLTDQTTNGSITYSKDILTLMVSDITGTPLVAIAESPNYKIINPL